MGEIVATKEIEGVTLTVEEVKPAWGPPPYYYGYARFDENPLPDDCGSCYQSWCDGEDWYDNRNENLCIRIRLNTHVRVHGTVIHMKEDDNGCMVYGFHTGYLGYQRDPNLFSKAWVLQEAERMALSIIALGAIEKQIVAAMDEIWSPTP